MTFRQKTLRGVLALAFSAVFAFAGLSASAQETSGSISGTVTDNSGAVVKGAVVTITNTDRNAVERTLTTNASGFYTATSLPLGTYSVKVSSTGFKTANLSGLVLHTSAALTVNRTLMAGSAGEVISVSANQVQLDLQDAASAGLINATQINQLVLSTRNYEQLITLQPGVAFGGAGDQLYVGPTNPSGGSNQINFSVNGGRNTSNNWTIDGADNVDRGANLTLLSFPSVDAIAEFKTLRGQYSAEFGRSASGQINVITKSGTNQIHGSAYEFIRNDFFNANGYFGNLNKTARPKYRYNDFGFSFGGPVVIPKLYNGRDKTFFFVSEEWRRFVNYVTAPALVPTLAERSGDFTNAWYKTGTQWTQGPVPVCTAYNPATGGCTASGTTVTNISPTALAYLHDVYAGVPAPQSQNDANAGIDPHTLNSTLANTFNNLDTVVRIDQQFGQKLSVFYRYLHDTFPTFQGSGTFVQVNIPGLSATVTNSPGTQHLGHVTYVFSPTLLANVGYAYSNGTITTVPQGSLLSALSKDINPTLPYQNLNGVVPTLNFNNYLSTIGGAAAYDDHDINHNAFGDVTKTIHNMTLIAGVSYNHFYKKENNNVAGNQGSFGFNNDTSIPQTSGAQSEVAFSNFLLGNVNNTFSQASTAQLATITENILEAYIQDNWKVTPRLTLNIGVRYSYFGQPTDGLGRLSNFDPALYSAAKAPTIDSSGRICLTAPCAGGGIPNPGADFVGVNYLNGYIFGGNTPNGHVSPFGNGKIGLADKANFAPRFGFAYDVFGDGKTALRGGYGWSYDESEVSFYESQTWAYPPPTGSCSVSHTTLDNPAVSCPANTPSTTPGRVIASPLNYHTPYVQQFSLDLQQQITPTFMVDIGYFGDHGTRLLGLIDLNESLPGAYVGRVSAATSTSGAAGCTVPGTTTVAFLSTACDQPLNQIKPYLGYFAVDAVRGIFSSNYNSLQVKATKHFSGQTYIDANYTWSRDLTNSQNDYSTPPLNTYNINGDYGRAAVDRTNILTFDGVYEFPWFRDQRGLKGRLIGGWEISVIYAINSGLPLTPTAGTGGLITYGFANPLLGNATTGGYVTDNAGIGIAGNTNASFRPDMIANPNDGHGRQIHKRLSWFDIGSFAAPPLTRLTPGNEKRGVIEGPGFNRADVGIFRNFRIYKRLNFQFRAEAFNLANHTNWQTVGTTSTSTSFGQVSATRDARLLQFAGKFTF